MSFELTSPTMGSSYPTAQSTPVVNRRTSLLTTPNNSAMSLDESQPNIRFNSTLTFTIWVRKTERFAKLTFCGTHQLFSPDFGYFWL